MPSDPQIDLTEFEEISPESYQMTNTIVKIWERLGRPDDPFSPSGEVMLNTLIAAWEYLLPEEARLWYEQRKQYQKAELSVKEQVHQRTGRSLASYPYFIFKSMKKVFPSFKAEQRDNCMRLVKKWPMFRMANSV